MNLLGRLKKDRQIRLFSRWMRVDEYFDTCKKERYFTCDGVKVFYKEAVLDVKELGRIKVFRLREEGKSEYRFYVANRFDMTARTCYQYHNIRWKIEDMHRDEKQYCGLKNTCAWKKETLVAHYCFVFFVWWLFERYRIEQGLEVSFESLWWEYCAGVDRAKMQRMQLGEPTPISMFFSYV